MEKSINSYKVIKLFILLIFSLVFFLINLLLEYTEHVPKSTSGSIKGNETPIKLQVRLDSIISTTAILNQFFGHFILYFLVFTFSRRIMSLIILADPVAGMNIANLTSHAEFLENLSEIERNYFSTASEDYGDRSVEYFED